MNSSEYMIFLCSFLFFLFFSVFLKHYNSWYQKIIQHDYLVYPISFGVIFMAFMVFGHHIYIQILLNTFGIALLSHFYVIHIFQYLKHKKKRNKKL